MGQDKNRAEQIMQSIREWVEEDPVRRTSFVVLSESKDTKTGLREIWTETKGKPKYICSTIVGAMTQVETTEEIVMKAAITHQVLAESAKAEITIPTSKVKS